MPITNAHSTASPPSTDLAVHDDHHTAFAESPFPSNPDAWIQRAAQVAGILAEDAAVREKENKNPFVEVSLLKLARLNKVLGPQKYGGRGQGWDVAKLLFASSHASAKMGQRRAETSSIHAYMMHAATLDDTAKFSARIISPSTTVLLLLIFAQSFEDPYGRSIVFVLTL